MHSLKLPKNFNVCVEKKLLRPELRDRQGDLSKKWYVELSQRNDIEWCVYVDQLQYAGEPIINIRNHLRHTNIQTTEHYLKTRT